MGRNIADAAVHHSSSIISLKYKMKFGRSGVRRSDHQKSGFKARTGLEEEENQQKTWLCEVGKRREKAALLNGWLETY